MKESVSHHIDGEPTDIDPAMVTRESKPPYSQHVREYWRHGGHGSSEAAELVLNGGALTTQAVVAIEEV